MADEPDLAELIRGAKGDRSYDRMSRDCGGNPTDKRLQQLAAGAPVKAFPDPPTLEGLARGTGQPVTAVVLAAARSVGLSVHAANDPDALIVGGARWLTSEQRETIFALVRVFNEMNQDAARATLEQTVSAAEHTVKKMIRMIKNRGAPDLTTAAPVYAALADAELQTLTHEFNKPVVVGRVEPNFLPRIEALFASLNLLAAAELEPGSLRRLDLIYPVSEIDVAVEVPTAAMEDPRPGDPIRTPPGVSEEPDT